MEEKNINNQAKATRQVVVSQKTLLERMVDFSYQKFLGRLEVAQKKHMIYEKEAEAIDKQRKLGIIKRFINKNKNI